MRYLQMTPTKGLLLASLAVLLLADAAEAQLRSRGGWRNPYYYSYPLTTNQSEVPFNSNVYTYPPTTYRSNYPPNFSSLPATIELTVPADAQVWFNGQATTQTGTTLRRFMTPPLNPEGDYSYEVKVSWMRDGQPVEETRQLSVTAGALRQVNFTQPAPTPER